MSERGARRRRECQSAGRDGGACVRARGATAVRKYSKCQPHANGGGSRARSKSKSKPSIARLGRGRRLKALGEAIATAVSLRPCGRRQPIRSRRRSTGTDLRVRVVWLAVSDFENFSKSRQARARAKPEPSVAGLGRWVRRKALVEAIATAVSPRPCGRRSARGRRATGGGGRKYSKCQPRANGRSSRARARSNLEIGTVDRTA